MRFKDYQEAVHADAMEFIRENWERFEDFEELFDEMLNDDSVTGNISGSYTMNRWQARENIAELIWDDDFHNELDRCERTIGELIDNRDEEGIDVIARFFALESLPWDDMETEFYKLRGEEE